MQDRALLILGLVISLLNVLAGIPLASRLVGPNGFYGWRTGTTLSSLAIWYDVNARMGWGLIVAGACGAALYLCLRTNIVPLAPHVKGVVLLSLEGIATCVATVVVALSEKA